MLRNIIANNFLYIQDAFHGPLRHYRKVPFVKVVGEPFSLITPSNMTKSVCERTPSKLSTYTILEPGMILVRNYVSLKDQVFVFSQGIMDFNNPNY
ncbi:hypothetical protein HanPSC8_Chr09g0393791 [Helianthus annuus]|nr:hypothetical protein HanPSC8_Chr09g0393791 [Helianthus annuus]